jgi:hypothetical protein
MKLSNIARAVLIGVLSVFVFYCGLWVSSAAAIDKLRIGYGAPSVA